jgi:hypothetical protein
MLVMELEGTADRKDSAGETNTNLIYRLINLLLATADLIETNKYLIGIYSVLFAICRMPEELVAMTDETTKTKPPWRESASELYRPSDPRLSAKLVSILAHRGCHVVSVTDPLRPYSRFSRPEPLLFLPSSSSIVLTRLSGPRSRPTTSQKIW